MIAWLVQILNKIGANGDAAALNTTLFAGQQQLHDDVTGTISSAPTAKSLRDILHKDGSFTFDAATDSLEAIRGKLDSEISGTEQVYTTGSGNWTVPDYVYSVDVLIVGGGGGGGAVMTNGNSAGGGGGGGETVLMKGFKTVPGEAIPYVVGAGGNGGAAGDNDGQAGGQSSFAGIVAAGGSLGRKATVLTGGKGGSATTGGDGGALNTAGSNGAEAATIISRIGGGGGGGGSNGSGNNGGAGGTGLFAGGASGANKGGGGGGSFRAGGAGTVDADGTAAAANSGGGGGGAGEYSGATARAGGNGGSGYVLIYWR